MSLSNMAKHKEYSPPQCDVTCGICCRILWRPITLLCQHTLCEPCFQSITRIYHFRCPFCRKSFIDLVGRKTDTIMDHELWNKIQHEYPEQCQRRANDQDLSSSDIEDASYPKHILAKPGEIRLEYETEMRKIEAERFAKEEEERLASENYIANMLAKEESEYLRVKPVRSLTSTVSGTSQKFLNEQNIDRRLGRRAEGSDRNLQVSDMEPQTSFLSAVSPGDANQNVFEEASSLGISNDQASAPKIANRENMLRGSLYRQKLEKEEERLMAVNSKKQLNKESAVNRAKRSSEKYHLRPKRKK